MAEVRTMMEGLRIAKDRITGLVRFFTDSQSSLKESSLNSKHRFNSKAQQSSDFLCC